MNYIANENDLIEVTKEGLTIVDFYADWCGPCRMIAPILEELDEENENIKVAKVNVDENRDLSMKYKISAIPAIMFFKDGKVVRSEVGFMTRDDLLEILEDLAK